jgi:hypothetical protein
LTHWADEANGGHSDCHSTSHYSALRKRTGWTTHPT